ncbi:endonuclease/exonuclease/phosphatase family protein, partial [Trifolium medium]|nr:endonuclease/exonuclease/phosphatase family protein [Trifolium medium]
WNLTVFGNVDHHVKSAVEEVTKVQNLIDENGMDDTLHWRDFDAQILLSKGSSYSRPVLEGESTYY